MKKQADYRRNHVLKWQQSGLSMKRYCTEHEISYWSFREWKKKDRDDSASKNGLVEIPTTIFNPRGEHEPIEIILKSGIRIIVKASSVIDQLKGIVMALDGLS